MLYYNVTVSINKDVEDEWVKWMNEIHIPDVMKAGFFKSYSFFKILIPTGNPGEQAYLVQYEIESVEKYEEYSKKAAPLLQKSHTEKFLGKFTASRALIKKLD